MNYSNKNHNLLRNEAAPTLGADLDANGYHITNIGSVGGDVHKLTDTNGATVADASTGDLDMNSNVISSLTDPTNAQDAATKNYVDNDIPSTLVDTNGATVIDASTGTATMSSGLDMDNNNIDIGTGTLRGESSAQFTFSRGPIFGGTANYDTISSGQRFALRAPDGFGGTNVKWSNGGTGMIFNGAGPSSDASNTDYIKFFYATPSTDEDTGDLEIRNTGIQANTDLDMSRNNIVNPQVGSMYVKINSDGTDGGGWTDIDGLTYGTSSGLTGVYGITIDSGYNIIEASIQATTVGTGGGASDRNYADVEKDTELSLTIRCIDYQSNLTDGAILVSFRVEDSA